jgi:hypothetical protein
MQIPEYLQAEGTLVLFSKKAFTAQVSSPGFVYIRTILATGHLWG